MKLEKIAQLIDITSNNNSNSSKNMMNKSNSSDILSYNLVAGNFYNYCFCCFYSKVFRFGENVLF